jgi:hypothetical protein
MRRTDKAPRHLSAEARDMWARFVDDWDLDGAALLILQTALESFDRMRSAQRLIAKNGLVKAGRANAAVVIERDSRLSMLRALRQLNLDLEPLRDGPGRPGGS